MTLLSKSNYLIHYIKKTKSLQQYEKVLEEMDLLIYRKYNEWIIPKNMFNNLLLDKDTKSIYNDGEWYYKPPINYKYPIMYENEKEYYKDKYIVREYLVSELFIYRKNIYPQIYDEIVANDFLMYSLNKLYTSNNITKEFKLYSFDWKIKKWLYSYDDELPKNEKKYKNMIDINEFITNPEYILEYIEKREKDYHKKIMEKLWSWKLIEDEKKKLILFMKCSRRKIKCSTIFWVKVLSYL